MKIASSSVSMSSAHELETHVSEKKAVLEVKAEDGAKVMSGVAAIYDGSASSMVLAMDKYRQQESRVEPPQHQAQERIDAEQMFERLSRPQSELFDLKLDEENSTKVRLLNRLLEALNGGKSRIEPIRLDGTHRGYTLDLRSSSVRMASIRAQRFSVGIPADSVDAPAVGTTSAGTLWRRVTATSAERTESEYTAFQSRGLAVTEDGRSIDFDVEFAMSRSFTAKYDSLTSESFVMTDPLIINLESGVTSVSDVKFRFDLDSDGQEEEISFAGDGSGFLALDVNGNGTIDDGSELFGTKSGDGFADLAAYDEDGNHWIDENDAVYDKLRVWTKDADGSDRLMNLREANVGAIYLGSVSTEFSLNDAATNETNAVIRKTGVYLKESGEVGTLSHVDLRC